MLLYELFERTQSAYPEKIAVSGLQHNLSYRQINWLALKCEAAVKQNCSEAPVIVSLTNDNPTIFALFLGIIKSGRPYFYLDPTVSTSTKNSLVSTINPGLTINEDTLSDILDIDDNLINQTNVSHDRRAASILVQTSGTTSQSRLVAISQHALIHNVSNHLHALSITCEDRLSLLTSPQFSAANSGIYAALLSGASLFPYSVKNHGLENFISWIAEEQITILHLTPSLFRLLADYIEYNALPSLRAIKLGGEMVFKEDVALYKNKFAPHCVLINGLGMSEAAGNIAHYIINHDTVLPTDSNIVPIGHALRGHQVLIIDEQGEALPNGATGEIIIRSDYLANGYWQNNDATSKKFRIIKNSNTLKELHTGDLGYFHDGLLIHLGRKDRLIKRHGYRIDLNFIETSLAKLKGIKRAVVYYTNLDDKQDFLFSCVQLEDEAKQDSASIMQQLEKHLPIYMLPQTIFILTVFPLTPSGKIDHQTILRQLRELKKNKVIVKPRNWLEQQLALMWREILKRDDIGVYDHFFEAGGDSLRAMELLTRLQREFQLTCDLNTLLMNPVIAQLAEAVQYHVPISAKENPHKILKVNLLKMRETTNNTLPPLIFISGNVMSEKELLLVAGMLAYLPSNRNVYAIRLNLQETELQLPNSVEKIAKAICECIRCHIASVTPVLIGECIACTLTTEIARQFALLSRLPPQLILLNPWHPRLPAEQKQDTRAQHIVDYFNLLRAWQPLTYAGKIDLVFAQEQFRTPQEFLAWWQNKTKNVCHLHLVPGDFKTYIRQHREYVAQIIVSICQQQEAVSNVC